MGIKGWKLNNNVKFRREYFGGYCWTQDGKFFELNHTGISIVELFQSAALLPSSGLTCVLNNFAETFSDLTKKRILVETNDKSSKRIDRSDFDVILNNNIVNSKRKILKPHWVHIQPFRYCNQRCIHCYCEADNFKSRFPMGLNLWKEIIDLLDSYGIWEIYITGGENFIVPECFELTSYIIEKNIGTGISTNGTCVTDSIVDWLRESGIRKVQVSLDGSNPTINDRIRGMPGAFEKTMVSSDHFQR